MTGDSSVREGGLRPPTPTPDGQGRWLVDPPRGSDFKPMTFDNEALANAYAEECPPHTRIADRRPPANPPNPKQRYGDTKVNLALVPPAGVIFAALGLYDGNIKYGPFNWRHDAVEIMTYIAACRRHLDAFMDGEELSEIEIWPQSNAIDPDADPPKILGGKPHLGHAIACLMILADAISLGYVIDNRPPPGPTPSLLSKWKKDLAR